MVDVLATLSSLGARTKVSELTDGCMLELHDVSTPDDVQYPTWGNYLE
jgi:hypothetical protein